MSKPNYIVKTGNWSMQIYVDEKIFDDPHVEACTRSVEEKCKQLKGVNDDDFLVNPVMIVKSTKRKNAREKTINTYKILLNAGMPGRAEILREVFYETTSIDLAVEPLSSSKK